MGETHRNTLEKASPGRRSTSKTWTSMLRIGCSWPVLLLIVIALIALAGTVIGLAAAAYSEFKSTQKRVQEVTGSRVFLSAPGIIASGLVVLVIACLVFIWGVWVLIQLLCKRQGKAIRQEQHGFHSVPTFYWVAGTAFGWLTIGSLCAWSAFIHYWRTEFIRIYGRTASGIFLEAELATANTLYNSRVKGWGLAAAMMAVAIVLWFVLLFATAFFYIAAYEYARDILKDDARKRAQEGNAPGPPAPSATGEASVPVETGKESATHAAVQPPRPLAPLNSTPVVEGSGGAPVQEGGVIESPPSDRDITSEPSETRN